MTNVSSEIPTDANKNLEQIEEWLDGLHEICSHGAFANPLDEGLSALVKLAGKVVHCDSCFIYIREGADLELWVWKHTDKAAVEISKFHVKSGIAQLNANRREALALVKDGHDCEAWRPFGDWSQEQCKASVMVPIWSRRELVGMVHLQHHEPHRYSETEMKLLLTATHLIGRDIGFARLEKENGELIVQLETRKLVERGKGILQRDLGLNEEQAYLALQRQSRIKRRSMREIAEAVVMSDEVRRSAIAQ